MSASEKDLRMPDRAWPQRLKHSRGREDLRDNKDNKGNPGSKVNMGNRDMANRDNMVSKDSPINTNHLDRIPTNPFMVDMANSKEAKISQDLAKDNREVNINLDLGRVNKVNKDNKGVREARAKEATPIKICN